MEPRESLFTGYQRWAQLNRVSVCHCVLEGRRLMNKKVRYVAIAFVIFYLISQPSAAAEVVNNALSAIGDAGNQLGLFISKLGT
jgi:hypothetical protein